MTAPRARRRKGITDKQRLDWVEKHSAPYPIDVRCQDGKTEWNAWVRGGGFVSAPTIREAIDKAIELEGEDRP